MSLVQQEFVICLNVYIKSVGSKSVGKRIAFSVILPIEYGHVWSYKELNYEIGCDIVITQQIAMSFLERYLLLTCDFLPSQSH